MVSVGGVSIESAVAVLSTLPASTSPCVTVYEPVQTSCPPGASVTGCEHVSAPSFGSTIVTPVSVVLPVFVAVSV